MASFEYDHEGLVLTEGSEGLRLEAYWDALGRVWTIGYGHTGLDVKPGMKITEAEAEILLKSDLAAAAAIVNHASPPTINQHQFDAMTDFSFNLGAANFLKSTLLKDVLAGNFAGAAEQFLLWVNAGGRRVAGLVSRRTKERAMFLETG